MGTDFSFFERSIREKRTYRFTCPWHRDRLMEPDVRDHLQVLRRGRHYMEVRGSHVLRPGCPEGVRAVEERFGVKLPGEVHDFYKRWNGGFLLHRELYPILSVQEIILTAVDFRTVRGEPTDPSKLPWHLFRFCDMSNSNYLALRRKAGRGWEVVWASVEVYDSDLIIPEYAAQHRRCVMDPSFLVWLRRMEDTDGWPWGESIMLPHDKPPSERIGYADPSFAEGIGL
ncbi:MAG: SMI1/KNR4 family protein [Planctomycetes bacterium]|nr:SMI1/KNR4 family protein [Planctomycetota bacterium]